MQKLTLTELKIDALDAIQCIKWKLLRSVLSALGIAIGTSALITMMSISEGARQTAEEAIEGLGADTIRVEPRLIDSSSRNLVVPLGYKDYLLLQNTLTDALVSPYVFSANRNVRFDGSVISTQILEIGPNWFDAEGITLERGRLFYDEEYLTGTQVCLVGSNFSSSSVELIGKKISWGRNICAVVGVLEARGSFLVEDSILSSINVDDAVITPLIGLEEPGSGYTGLTIKAEGQSLDEIKAYSEKVTNALMRQRQTQDFISIIPSIILEKASEERRTFNIIMGTIAGLSLLVGGIGVMNIMLAHVAEQRIEIGLRLSLGATKARIASLFLIYSFMMSLLGTAAGIVLGILGTLIIQMNFEWEVVFSTFSLLAGPCVSLISGLVFGVYPAVQATQVNPSEIINQG